jgi:hypothetical protein
LIAPAFTDAALIELAGRWQKLTALPLGAPWDQSSTIAGSAESAASGYLTQLNTQRDPAMIR